MKLTKKKVEQAKEAVKRGQDAAKVVKTWDGALKDFDGTSRQDVTAVNIDDDGSISYEVEVIKDKPIVRASGK